MARKTTTAKAQPKLLWFEVENFKSIKRVHVALQPLKVFVGPHDAGKADLLEAFALLLEMFGGNIEAALARRCGFAGVVRRPARRGACVRLILGIEVPRGTRAPRQAVIEHRISAEHTLRISLDDADPTVDVRWIRCESTKQQAELLALEQSPAGALLLVEEPERALDPAALSAWFGRLRSGRTAPILLTTQSPALLDAMADPWSLFLVEDHPRNGATITPALHREGELREILAETGQTLGQFWRTGRLDRVTRRRA